MKKRKREDEKPAPDPPLIKLEYTNLPTESRHKLDTLLHEWKDWHAQRFPEGFRPPEVLSGTLRYEPNGALSSLPISTLPVLDDRPAPSENPITRSMWFNVQYERTGEVPTYERSIDRPLKLPKPPPAARNDLKTPPPEPLQQQQERNAVVAFPGIGSAASDRVLIQTGGAGGGGFSGSGQAASKRQRLGQRCFNCGSYAHSLHECWKDRDNDAIEEARRRIQGVTGGGGGGAPKRYFLIEEKKKKKNKEERDNSNGAATSDSESSEEEEDGELEESLDEEELTPCQKLQREFPSAAPGVLSSSLREALGIGPFDAPPWLHAMRAMGLPPAYSRQIPEGMDNAAADDGAKIEEKGEEKKKQEQESPPPPPPPPPQENETSEPVLSLPLPSTGEKGLLLPVIEDRVGVDTAAIVPTAVDLPEKVTKHHSEGATVKEETDDFIQLPILEEEESEEESNEEYKRRRKEEYVEVKFPGVNAPIPEGADPVQWEGGFGGGANYGGGGTYNYSDPGPLAAHPHAPYPQQQAPPQPPVVQNPVPMYSVAVPPHTSTAAAPPPPPGMYFPPPPPSYQRPSYPPAPSTHHGAPADYAPQPQHGYHHQDWYQQQPPLSSSYHHHQQLYNNQGDYSNHQQGGYYHQTSPPVPASPASSVLPYQPPPPHTQQQQFNLPPPPPPPTSDAGHLS